MREITDLRYALRPIRSIVREDTGDVHRPRLAFAMFGERIPGQLGQFILRGLEGCIPLGVNVYSGQKQVRKRILSLNGQRRNPVKCLFQ